MNITAKKRHQEELKIYIDGTLHLSLKTRDIVAIQSWISENEYCIEFSYSSGCQVRSAYSSKEKWTEVLKIVDKNIGVI